MPRSPNILRSGLKIKLTDRRLALIWLLVLASAVFPGHAQPLSPAEKPASPEETIEQEIITKISPGVHELAQQLGLTETIEKLLRAQAHGPYAPASREYIEVLSYRQQLMETVLSTILEIHGVTAAIDYEISQNSDFRAYLEDRRDRAIKYNTIATLITGGISGALGNALDINPSVKVEDAGDILEMAGGGVTTALGFLALRQEGGEKRKLPGTPNMLAKLFDRPTTETTEYPRSVWDFLNAVPAGVPGKETRRQRLIKRWVSLGLLESPRSATWRYQVEHVTSTTSRHHKITIGLLEKRIMMLTDLRALVLQMERGLHDLLTLFRLR